MAFTTKDLLTVAGCLREAALAEIMPRFRSLSAHEIRQKSSALDLVTDADEAAERFMTARLKELFPGCAVIGEESTEKDRSLLTKIAEPDLLLGLILCCSAGYRTHSPLDRSRQRNRRPKHWHPLAFTSPAR